MIYASYHFICQREQIGVSDSMMKLYFGCVLVCCSSLLFVVEGLFFGPDSLYCDEVGETFTKNTPFNSLPLPECFSTYFYLTTSSVTKKQISETNIPSDYSSSKKTIFLVHGFRGSYDDDWQPLFDALQKQGDFNLITTDWSEGSQKNVFTGYDNAASNTRVAAKALYNLFRALQNAGLSRTNSHCIGHSLGAHICGLAGQYEKFGRISGMDPAGPEFEKLLPTARLSADDADFTDVLHTNGGGNYLFDYGTLIEMGHLDFYPNGGQKQRGCIVNKRTLAEETPVGEDLEKIKLSNLQKKRNQQSKRGVIYGINCSHGRALALYAETVNSLNCVANISYSQASFTELTPCTNCASVTPVAGYHSDAYSSYPGMYGFRTFERSPYCG